MTDPEIETLRRKVTARHKLRARAWRAALFGCLLTWMVVIALVRNAT